MGSTAFISSYATNGRLAALTTIQVVGYGLLYYSGLVALPVIATDTGWSFAQVSLALSASMMVSAITSIPLGRFLDRTGPRLVMIVGTLLGALGMVLVANAQHLVALFAGFLVLGLAIAGTLYGVAFTTITHRYQNQRNRPLVILTIAAGFASTIFAPITAWLIESIGWRSMFLVGAAVFLSVSMPLVLISMERRWDLPTELHRDNSWGAIRSVALSGRFLRLLVATLLIGVGLYTATVNAVPLLLEQGFSFETAAWGLGIIGAGQVLGRFVFYAIPGRRLPWVQLSLAGGLSALLLLLMGVVAAPFIAVAAIVFFVGAGRGAMTLVDATAVSDRWGTNNYGALSGVLHAPTAITLGVTPAIGVFLAEALGSFAAMVIAMAGVVAVGAVLGRWT